MYDKIQTILTYIIGASLTILVGGFLILCHIAIYAFYIQDNTIQVIFFTLICLMADSAIGVAFIRYLEDRRR